MLQVGVTGGIGSGKSTVTARLRARLEAAGVPTTVVDADAIARLVVEPGTPGLAAIAERFGDDVLDADGRLDRPLLADRVFGDDEARRDLSAITHPLIGAEMARQMAETPTDGVCLLDVPLLVEDLSRSGRRYDVVVVVVAPREVKLDRLVARGLRRDDAAARMASQVTDEERVAMADVVIDNAGSLADLERALAPAVERVVAARAARTAPG